MKKGIKAVLLLLVIALLAGMTACAPPEPDKDGEKDETLAKNYDFGDPSGWSGNSMAVTDLGDCLLDAYPYDDKYDWGQSILWDEETQSYQMWWCRNSGYDTIWYAESKDLKHWTNAQKLMTVEQDTNWIKMHVGKPSVLKVDGQYIMYFEAPATLLDYEFDNNVLMARSEDGIHWEMYEGDAGEPYPVIRMTDEQMAASMAQYQAQGNGYYGIGQPSALYHDGKYYVYCTYSLEQGDRMYVFTSDDGIHFSEGQRVFDRANCGVKFNTLTQKFMMAYEYTQNGVSRVYYMESDDGIDDHGTMIGDTATIYRLGKKLFRCGWLMNAMRGGGKLHLYGKVDLLDDSDLEYMREVSDVFDDINAGIYETSCILGDARRAEVYGYSISEGDTGYAVILNPATYARPFSLSLPEWENCSIVVERIIENGEKVNSEEKIFTNYTGEISPNGYRLFRWKRLQRVSREGKLVLDAHSELVLCTNGKDVALRFERNGLPLRSLLGYPEGLIVTDGEKVLQSSVETDIWSGISWLYFRVHGEKELHVCYNGDENIAMAYSLEGYRNEHD